MDISLLKAFPAFTISYIANVVLVACAALADIAFIKTSICIDNFSIFAIPASSHAVFVITAIFSTSRAVWMYKALVVIPVN